MPNPLTTSLQDNQRPDVGVTQRQLSPIIGLKSFNNWVKSVLIARFAHPVLRESLDDGRKASSGQVTAGRVLDMGCGRRGRPAEVAEGESTRIRRHRHVPRTTHHDLELTPS